MPQPRTNPKTRDNGRRTAYMPLKEVISGNRVSPAPRRAPSMAKKMPTAGMLIAWIRMNVTLQLTTTGSPMKPRAIGSARRKMTIAMTLITATENFVASQPLLSAATASRAPRFCPTRAVAAIAAPGTPRRGTNAFPKIRFTLIPKFTMFTRTPIHRGVTVSPAPRRAALPRKPMNWKNTTREMMRMYAPPKVTTSASAPKAASIGSAKTRPNSVSGLDRRAPRTRLSFRTWSASSRRFAPIARATRAIVPADTEIMTLKKRNMNWPPNPTAATAAGASAPRDPTMITSTVVVRVWRMFAIITGQASWKTDILPIRAAASAGASPIPAPLRRPILVPWFRPVPTDLDEVVSASRFVVELEEDDLLPGAHRRRAGDHRDREAGPEERRANMAVSVSILPSSFVAVRQALRKESLEGGGDVLRHEARLEFVRDDCARAARREDACEAFGDLALRDDVEHLAGNVDGLGAGARFHGDYFMVGNHEIGKETMSDED